MEGLPFKQRVPLLNMTLGEAEDSCAAAWLHHYDQSGDSHYQSGEQVQALHDTIATLWHTPFVASFMGGRASLYAIIRTLNLAAGDQILLPAFTCQCVTNALTYNAVEPRFVDIETETYGMDIRALTTAITPRCKAILIQYTFGLVCRDLPQLIDFAREHGLWIIEDCAHATGGCWQGQLLGTLGDIAFFSSERSKIVNTIHGGWVITANPILGERLQQVYQHSEQPDTPFIQHLLQTLRHSYREVMLRKSLTKPAIWLPQMQANELRGLFSRQYQWRMAEPVAELLRLQLSRLAVLLAKRRAGAAFWQKWLEEQGMQPPLTVTGALNTWLRFPVLLPSEQRINKIALEQALNVEIGEWFSTPMHPASIDLPDCPQGMWASGNCINLPTFFW